MRFSLPQNVNFVLDTLINNGHKAYIVGGCVRDLLCGKTPHDFDITTSALPNEVQTLFEKTIATGIKHGTVTVMVDKTPLEVTTFRTESTYNDSRHPESVSFVSNVRDDLARRDFTVNAMCYNNCEGLIDVFDGVDDIKNKILRAVGDAKQRFTEDALRILRLFRFAATLRFKVEKNTLDAALNCAPLLKNISAERIFTELKKAAQGDAIPVLSSLLQTNALSNFCLKNADLTKLKNLQGKENLRTFALLYLTSTNLPRTLDSLKCSNAFKDYCLKLGFLVKNKIGDNKIDIKKALNFAEIDIVFDAFIYYRDVLNVDTDTHTTLLDEIKTKNEPYKISQLKISGNDIASFGFKGHEIGEILNSLLDEVIENPDLNERQKLLNLICN